MFAGLAMKLGQRGSDGQELILQPRIGCGIVFETSIDSPDQRSCGKILGVQGLKKMRGRFGVRGGGRRNANGGFRGVARFGNWVVEQAREAVMGYPANVFGNAVAEEQAKRFDRLTGIDGHRIGLAGVEKQIAAFVHETVSFAGAPSR